ncbi:cytochrome P450 [Streptomyces albireticuli]|uniref:Cytochrome P450 n=1 Tax=Streptomyces albireticuli TaxID=1940 RepID=A0A1Z2KWE0_9ACTN|nr:cytochrome P450 [Streptomyces albireticuli]ARZ66368.1 cytochrome P450 [Streptomyces albireticuli]
MQDSPVTPHRLDPTGADQHADNDRLRARGPAVPVVLPGEVAAVAVTRHEELKAFLAHPDVAKNACHFAALREGAVPPGWPLATFATVEGMTTADGDDHRRLRGLVTQVFTPRRVEGLRPRVEELTTLLLDALGEAAFSEETTVPGVVDLREHFALPLPMAVISELLGVDPDMRGRLHELSNLIVSTTTTRERALAANRDMAQVLGLVVARRRAAPGDDLTSALLAAQAEDGDRLDDRELVGTLLLMVIAGHETTLNLITNAVRALCTHPEQLALVRAGAASWADVVEETLRYDSPVSFFPFRYPTRDLKVGDTVIPRGTPVLASYTAAGRDERAHGSDAARFLVTRRPAVRHLSFGHGPHYCLGAQLARLEATTALEALFDRYPGLALAVPDRDLPRHPSFVGNSTEVLPVRLHPIGLQIEFSPGQHGDPRH